MQNRLKLTSALLLLVFLAGCGGFFVSSGSVVSIVITPNNSSVQPAKTQQFTATATLGSGGTSDVTSQVAWTSSATSVATINSTGLASAVTVGSATITATSN